MINADEDRAVEVAERIRHKIEKNIVHYRDDIKVNVTVTIGVSSYKGNKSIQEMMDDADAKLYYGKRNGKNQVVNVLKNDENVIAS